MYPVLVASGGIITFIYDFRHRLLSKIRPRRRRISSTSTTPVDPTIELQPMASSPVDVPLPPLAKTRSGGQGHDTEDPNKKQVEENTTESGLRQRHPATISPAIPVPVSEPSDERLRTRLIVPPPHVAYTLGGLFVAVVLTLVVLRAKYPVDPVPRALDFVA